MAIKRINRNGLVKSPEDKLRYEIKELKERIEAIEKQLSILSNYDESGNTK